MNKVFIILFLLFLVSCSSVKFVPHDETSNTATQIEEQNGDSKPASLWRPNCRECLVVPRSGSNKDLRHGYYYDQEQGKCVEISYSTGQGCIPPPFKTLDECISCCGR